MLNLHDTYTRGNESFLRNYGDILCRKVSRAVYARISAGQIHVYLLRTARHRRRFCRRRRRRLRYVVDWMNVNLALNISTPCLNPV